MATTIVTKSGSGAPTASDLVAGELAVDLTNKRLYTEDSGGTVLEVGSNPYNFTANHDGSAKLATTATGIDVTGSVTADGLTSSGDLSVTGVATIGADAGGEANVLTLKGRTSDNDGYIKFTSSDGATSYAYAGVSSANTLAFYTNGFTKRLDIGSGGDISFYEDTGTTPKLFWDASAESLGIGTSSPQTSLSIETSGTQDVVSPVVTGQTAGVTYGGLYTVRDGAGDQRGLDLKVYTANVGLNTAMRLDSLGNLKVGSSSIQIGYWEADAVHDGYLIPYNGSGQTELVNSFTTGALVFKTGTSKAEAMRIDSSGLVGIGSSTMSSYNTSFNDLVVDGGTNSGATIVSGTTGDGTLAFADGTTGNEAYRGYIQYTHAGDDLKFGAAGVERMRIDASGNLLVGKSTFDDGATKGFTHYSGSGDSATFSTRSSNPPLNLNRLNSDGEILRIRKDGTTVGSISSRGGLTLGLILNPTSGTGAGLSGASNAIFPIDETTTPVNGEISLGTESNAFKDLYLSGGVVFGDAGGSGTSTSNTLDSYEEGTWTPTYTDDSGNVITNLTNQSGRYVKIGNMVYISGALRTQGSSDASGLSGDLSISGLPFTQVSSEAHGQVTFYTHESSGTYNAPAQLPRTSSVASNTTRIHIYKYSGSGGRTVRFLVSDLTMSGNSNFMFFSGTYETS